MRPELNLKPARFSALSGWGEDDHLAALNAFKMSCKKIIRSKKHGDFESEDPRFGSWQNWRDICEALDASNINDKNDARIFFETHFTPYQAAANDELEGLFTGYYVASLRGADKRDETYKHPIYAKPEDLVMVDLGQFRDDLKGRRIAGRVKGGRLYPYEDRMEIEQEGLDTDILLWADDAVDVFFLHIQGSGRVEMADGSARFIGYAGQNGHPYHAIGKFLIESGEVAREDMSMQAIRSWLNDNPAKRDDLLNRNPSYVFFRDLKRDAALGGQGVALTPERSLAVDHTYYPYGAPIWLNAENPEAEQPALRRLMVAQDTGGAIRGPVRGDVFWGYGARAERLAGAMKSKGQFWVLLPKQVRPSGQL